MPNVERPRRIGADVFNLNVPCLLRGQLPILLSRGKYGTQRIGEHGLFKVEIEETGSCDLRMIEPIAHEMLFDCRCNLLRGLTKDTRRLHGKVCRKISKLFFRRLLQKNTRQCTALRQLSFGFRCLHGTHDRLLNLLFDIQLDLISFILARFLFPAYYRFGARRPHRARRKYTPPLCHPEARAHADGASPL